MPFFANLVYFAIILAIIILLAAAFILGAGVAVALILNPKPESPWARLLKFYLPLFAAVALMIAPVALLGFYYVASGPRDFELFFGEPPPPTVKILRHSSWASADSLEVDLTIKVSNAEEWRRLAEAAGLDHESDADAPFHSPPFRCGGAVEVWLQARPDAMRWDEKWALYCPTDSRVRAFAVMVD